MRDRGAAPDEVADAMPADELRRVGHFGTADGAAAEFRRLACGLDTANRACRRGETGRGFGPCRDAGVRAVESVRLLMDLDLHRAAGLVVGGLEGFPDPLQREAVGHHGIEDHSA